MLQDRATAAFTGAIPTLRLEVAGNLELHRGDSGTWIYEDLEAPTREVVVPVDFYLREALELDPYDDQSVAAFIDEWGLPVDRLNRDLIVEDDDLDRDAHGEGTLSPDMTLSAGRVAAAVELGWVNEGPPVGAGFRAHGDFALANPDRPAAIQRLVNWSEAGTRLYRMHSFSRWAKGDSTDREAASVVNDLNAALSVFAPRIEAPGVDSQRPTIYNAVAAQIANDLYEGASFLTCQNETCGRTFTKQRGRAEYGAHRTKGVLYCSKDCAKAQAQRELRRRRRKEQNNA